MFGSLQQNAIDTAIQKRTRRLAACVRADGQHLNTYSELLLEPKQNHGQIIS